MPCRYIQVNWSRNQDTSVTGPALIKGDATIDLCIEWSVAERVTHLSRNSEDVGSNPGTGRYIVARMTT